MTDPVRTRRRNLLSTLASGLAVGLAGCSGESEEPTATATPESGVVSPTDRPGTATATPESGVVTPTDRPGTPTPTPTATARPTEVTVSDDESGTLRERVRRVGTAVRPGTIALRLGEEDLFAAGGWVFEQGLVATSGSRLREYSTGEPEVRYLDERTESTTVLGSTEDPDVGALATDEPAPRLPVGSSDELAEGQVLVVIGHGNHLTRWIIKFGRFRGWVDDGSRFLSTVPTVGAFPGGPTMTLDGEVVGMDVGKRPHDPPADTEPPQTEEPTVYTNESEWSDMVHEPVEGVVGQIEEWTG